MRGPLAWTSVLLACTASPAFADSCVWFSHEDSIRQVRTDTNQVTLVVPLRSPHRLVMNAEDCGVWTLDKHDRRILRFSAGGVLEREIRVRDLHPRLDEVDRLHLDPYDGSLWVTDDRRVFHFSTTGELLGQFRAPGEIRRLRVALDQTLWVLGKRELWRFDAAGSLLSVHDLGHRLAGDARFLIVDNVGGFIWLADDNDVARLDLSDPPKESALRIRIPHHITGFTLDPLTGNVWVARKNSLLAISRTGSQVHSINLDELEIRKPEKLAFDPVSRSLWASAEKSVSRFTDTGQLVARFSAKDGDEALGVPAFKVRPTLTLVRPPQDALTNNAQPEFRLGHGADCNGASCDFPASYFGSYQLTATLNSQDIGDAFLVDAGTGESFFTSAGRLPEGTNIFVAQTRDRFAHSSNAVSSTFTVDTIAPKFLTVLPADGSSFQTPAVVLEGTIDDPQASVVLEGIGVNPPGQAFSFPVTLAAGPNTFTLSAIDRAGNRATTTLRLNLVPVSVTIESPLNGSVIASDGALVTGVFQGPQNAGVSVNGAPAAIEGGRFYAQISLAPGANLLSVVATSPDGATAMQSVSVTSTGPAPVGVFASPASGMAPLNVSFGAFSNLGFTRLEADYDGNGSVDFTTTDAAAAPQHVYSVPGTYQARFSVVDGQGTTHTVTRVIVVSSVASVDAVLRGAYSGMLDKLRAGNVEGALTAFTVDASEKYKKVFTALGPGLPSVANQLGVLQEGSISGEFAEYVLVRGQKAFFVYFIRGQDGVWRIEGM